jgi:hypothetical protein
LKSFARLIYLTMSRQLPVPPKRGRGRPPKVREPEPETESENEQEQIQIPNHVPENTIHSRFAIPTSKNTLHGVRQPVQEPEEDMTEILQQIQDSELAMALDESYATYTANTQVDMNYGATNNLVGVSNDDDLSDILQKIRAQEEQDALDAELARQLAREMEEEDNPQPQGDSRGDDMDDVLEQIREMEAKEQLQKKGNAFAKPISLNRLMAQQDEEDEEIRRQAKKQIENEMWRAERERQDREFQEVLRQDQEKELLKRQPIPTHIPIVNDIQNDSDDVEDEPIPQTKEDIRAARLKFFSKMGK